MQLMESVRFLLYIPFPASKTLKTYLYCKNLVQLSYYDTISYLRSIPELFFVFLLVIVLLWRGVGLPSQQRGKKNHKFTNFELNQV